MTANAGDNAGQSDLLTIPQAAARLGKSERTLRRWITSGKLGTVDIGGVCYVQLGDTGTPADMSGDSVQMTAHAAGSDRHMSEPIVDALRDTIRRQDAEIVFLRDHLDRVTRMLPAPQSRGGNISGTDQARGRVPVWIWIALAAIVAAGAGIGGYALWLNW